VWFSGARDDVEKILNGFDIFVLSSIAEGVSLSLLEAMSAQLPVVATMVGGNIEVVQEDCGKLVPAGRPDVMAEALLEYIDNAELRQTHGRNGRNRVLAHFSLKNMVRHYEALYTTGPR
jgi:glycosyltransferase involved in cell wall biosynthesis